MAVSLESDSDKWDRKYLNRKHGVTSTPDPLLVESVDLLANSDVVVDLACGTGRHSIYLASLGYFTVALDCSREALEQCRISASSHNVKLHAVAADLQQFRFGPRSVDALVCFNYLNRELAQNMVDALRKGGILIFKTFNRNFQFVNANFNEAYMLAPGELKEMFGNLKSIHSSDDCQPSTNTKSFLVARKIW